LEAFDQLDLVAEIAAALLGFIAIFLALSKTDGRFAASDRHFVQALVMCSALAIVLAIAPRSIGLFFVSASVWYTALILAIILGSLVMLLQVRQQLQMSRDEAAQIHWLWHLLAWTLGVSSAMLLILALFDSTRMTVYNVGAVSLLIPLSHLCFIGVVFRRFF
jgi:hypothetical protein